MKRLIILPVLLLCTFWLHGQRLKAFEEAATKSMAEKDYYSALTFTENALEFDDARLDLQYQAAEAARNFNAYKRAIVHYTYVVDKDTSNTYPLSSFYLAQMQRSIGQYDSARVSYQLYISAHGGEDEYITERANSEMNSLDWAIANSQITYEDVVVEHLGGNVNTPYTEFGPLGMGDTLYFSSLRFENKKDPRIPTRKITKVLNSIGDATSVEYPGDLNAVGLHTAHTTFNKDQSRMYYTICEYQNAHDIRCDLYYRDVTDTVMGTAIKIGEPVNTAGYTTTQPSVGFDDFMQKEYLYFSSDRPGGKGRMDLYYVEIMSDGTFGSVMSLDSLNTTESDISPFFHNNSQTLYFSSYGHVGLGGYDIFASEKQEYGWEKARNLEIPVNSSYNDLYYSLDPEQKTGYFASNRLGSIFLDDSQEACCNDIYKLTYQDLNLTLKALTFDAGTRLALEGATVTLIERSNPGNPIVISNPTANDFHFDLDRSKDYTLIATRPGYLPDTVKFTTKGIRKSQEIVKELYLRTEKIDLEVLTFNKLTQAALNGATIRLIDINDPANESIAQMDYNSNQLILPIKRGNTYRIIATKKGFSPDEITLNTNDLGDASRHTVKLYLGQGNLEDFLPLALYFDNDYPDPRTYKSTTKKAYSDTYPSYIAKKSEFNNVYLKPLTPENKPKAEKEIDRFFEDQVRGGSELLDGFMKVLDKTLASGQNVKIEIQGYTSPRASSKYNDALAKRRINSVTNQIKAYNKGALSKYLGKQLTITEKSFGESTAPRFINDQIKNRRESIYSIPASKERRAEIINVTRN